MASETHAESIAPILTSEGWELLNSLGPYSEAESLHLGTELRKAGHSPELVAAAMTQSRLRAKAEAKFGPVAFLVPLPPCEGSAFLARVRLPASGAGAVFCRGTEGVVTSSAAGVGSGAATPSACCMFTSTA